MKQCGLRTISKRLAFDIFRTPSSRANRFTLATVVPRPPAAHVVPHCNFGFGSGIFPPSVRNAFATLSNCRSNSSASVFQVVKSAATRFRIMARYPLCQSSLNMYPSRLSGIILRSFCCVALRSSFSFSSAIVISSSTQPLVTRPHEWVWSEPGWERAPLTSGLFSVRVVFGLTALRENVSLTLRVNLMSLRPAPLCGRIGLPGCQTSIAMLCNFCRLRINIPQILQNLPHRTMKAVQIQTIEGDAVFRFKIGIVVSQPVHKITHLPIPPHPRRKP